MSEERMRILQMVSEGVITAEQAAQLIHALEESGEPEEAAEIYTDDLDPVEVFEPYEVLEQPATGEAQEDPRAASADEPMYEVPPDFKKWSRFWYIPLAAGVLITAVSGLLVYAGTRGSWNWFWMACVWGPLLLGIIVILFSWMSRTARWLHLRVNTGQDEWPRRITISLPLPLRMSAWLLRTFGHFIPGLDDVPLPIAEAILALETSLTPDDPLYVHVEDTGGERVEIFIG